MIICVAFAVYKDKMIEITLPPTNSELYVSAELHVGLRL